MRHALVVRRYGFGPFLHISGNISNILQSITSIVTKPFKKLKDLIVFKQFLCGVATEVWGSAVSMEFIDDPNLIIHIPDILSPIVLTNLNIDVSIHNEMTSIVQLEQFFIQTVQQALEDQPTDYRPGQDKYSTGNEYGFEIIEYVDGPDVDIGLESALGDQS